MRSERRARSLLIGGRTAPAAARGPVVPEEAGAKVLLGDRAEGLRVDSPDRPGGELAVNRDGQHLRSSAFDFTPKLGVTPANGSLEPETIKDPEDLPSGL